MTFVIDVDGVLANLMDSMFLAIGRSDLIKEQKLSYQFMEKVHEAVGMSAPDFWETINKNMDWSKLPIYPWAYDLVNFCKERGNILFATSPVLDPDSAKGKMEWIQDHFPENSRDFAITPRKHLFAAPGRLLIDDHEKNVRKFSEFGGKALLFPQKYNALSYIRDEEKLNFMKGLIRIYAS